MRYTLPLLENYY